MSDLFAEKLIEWQRYAKSPICEKLSTWGKRCAQWEKRIHAHPYKLTVEQYILLRQTPFPLADVDVRWLDQYVKLGQFRQSHGHCFVPLGQGRDSLGMWVSVQRTQRKKGKLSPEKERALNRFGFCWDVLDFHWQRRVSGLKAFIGEYGHMRVPDNGPHHRLANWIESVRGSKLRINSARRRQLDQIGFIWKVHSSQWRRALVELERFVQEKGHADVPQTCPEYPKAAAMLSHQRSLFKSGAIDADRRRQLEALGVRWNIYDAVWEERYEELTRTFQKLGHVQLPKGWPENKRLERWLRAQREKWSRLPSDYQRRLAELGVTPERNGKRKRCTYKDLILRALEEAGPAGLKVDEIGRQIEANPHAVAMWFHVYGRKIPEIEKIAHGRYRKCK